MQSRCWVRKGGVKMIKELAPPPETPIAQLGAGEDDGAGQSPGLGRGGWLGQPSIRQQPPPRARRPVREDGAPRKRAAAGQRAVMGAPWRLVNVGTTCQQAHQGWRERSCSSWLSTQAKSGRWCPPYIREGGQDRRRTGERRSRGAAESGEPGQELTC